MHQIAMGKADVDALRVYYAWNDKAYKSDSIRMLFVSNHDKNSWEGTEFEQFGDALEAAIVLSVVSDGMPLIYNGQEAGNDKRLEFFESDPIQWREHPMGEFYRRLLALKRGNRALWNGVWGARMVEVRTSDAQQVLAFVRDGRTAEGEGGAVAAVFNFSDQPRAIELTSGPHAGTWQDFDGGAEVELAAGTVLDLPAWGWKVFTA